MKIGDLVLIFYNSLPRGLWPLGLVIDVKPGKDELVRTVTVKSKHGIYVRPINKLVLLEGDNHE